MIKSWRNYEALHQEVASSLLQASESTSTTLPLTDELATWLAQLSLLYGVPVEYMVADARLLPTESMRFFYVDRNWTNRLIDGAISVGVLSSMEKVFNEAFFERIYAQVNEKQVQLRAILRSTNNGGQVVDGTLTGLLFRSQVVSGWPGLEVNASAKGTALDLLRMDRLSDNTLLCLFNGIPDTVDFIEPGEGLHFGINREADADTFNIYLRGLGFPKDGAYPAGEQIKDPDTPGGYLQASSSLRGGTEKGVVAITDLVSSLESKFPSGALENGTLTPGGFAVQMVQGAGFQQYVFGENYPICEAE
ncbi:hypothetical protein [Parapedobacter indicus]|uniref:Uncharacterized protein n=1 Tax=Parapedobacter indicus TaxID=1477437 RepID=A0A1I3HNI2_9SPHI|nr:hypothetical protein [Parapedobacter indicus]PPL03104.1 hypothetical protein CLV26_103430 [Parapedobacter indicus]SFI37137.1 hypothetical protein SAMN05444682_103429 [Parapedobacter indicus]